MNERSLADLFLQNTSFSNNLYDFSHIVESWPVALKLILNPELEKAMVPHSSTLAWKILWTEEPGRLQSMGSLRVGTTEQLHFHFSLSCIGEGKGNPLQCFCLENPRDAGAWWAAVYGVAQSHTRLKWLSSSSSKPRTNSILWGKKKKTKHWINILDIQY